jgi:hypothetical protein
MDSLKIRFRGKYLKSSINSNLYSNHQVHSSLSRYSYQLIKFQKSKIKLGEYKFCV